MSVLSFRRHRVQAQSDSGAPLISFDFTSQLVRSKTSDDLMAMNVSSRIMYLGFIQQTIRFGEGCFMICSIMIMYIKGSFEISIFNTYIWMNMSCYFPYGLRWFDILWFYFKNEVNEVLKSNDLCPCCLTFHHVD